MTPDEISIIEGYLDALLLNQPIEPHDGPEELKGIRDRFVKLSDQLETLQQFAAKLYKGDVEAAPPPRDHYIASGLKQLQSQLIHLTWQAQRVAGGDYLQRVDFMGDFSQAFNEMVEQLQNREASLKETQDVMERVFNLIEPIIVVSEEDSCEVLYTNDMAMHAFGVKTGKNTHDSFAMRHIVNLPPVDSEQEVFDPDTGKWHGVTVRKLTWGKRNNARLYYCRDVTSHKERENSLDIVANTDELTGIGNRRAFDPKFAQLWSMCLSAQKPISVIVFDIDHFKIVNDTLGHLNGDRLLSEFAHVLKRSIARKDDVVARYGGEEFIAAMAFTNEANALRIARTVCELTEHRKLRLRDNDGQEVEASITVSAGVSSVIPTESMFPSRLIQTADAALYQAKRAGRNQARFLPVSGNPPTQAADE